MLYSRKITRRDIAKRTIASCVATGIIMFLIGIAVGFCVCHVTAQAETCDPVIVEPLETETIVIQSELIEEETEAETEPVEDSVIEEAEQVNIPYVNCRMPQDQQEYLYWLCDAYGLDFLMVMALIDCESSYNPKEISSTNDYGLMQINRGNHSWLKKQLGISDFLDPYQNMQAGCYMLWDLFNKYKDPNRVLMAYNMGEENATRNWNKGTHSSAYSRKVMNKYQEYQVTYGG